MKFVTSLMILCLLCSGTFGRGRVNEHEVTLPLTRIGKKMYYIEANTQATWFGALHFCTLHNLRLAKIYDEHENTELGEYLTKLGVEYSYFWLSGNDLVETGSWFWAASGEKISFFNWAPDEPNNANPEDEHCLNAYALNGTLLWNDDVCTFHDRHFICELV